MTLADMPPPPSISCRAQLNPKSDDPKRLRYDIDKELLSARSAVGCFTRDELRAERIALRGQLWMLNSSSSLHIFQVACIETLGEPIVDFGEPHASFVAAFRSSSASAAGLTFVETLLEGSITFPE